MTISKEIENDLPECSWVCVRKGKEICVVKTPYHCSLWPDVEYLQMDVWIQKVW